MSEEKLLLRWSLVLGCEPAQPKPSSKEPSQADHSQAQWSGKWDMQHGWPLGVYPSLFVIVLGLGLGHESTHQLVFVSGDHVSLAMESICCFLFVSGITACHCQAAGALPPRFCPSGQAELSWGAGHLLCVKHLLFSMLLLLILLLLVCVPYSLLLSARSKFLFQSIVSAFVPLTRERWKGRECTTWGLFPSWF